MHIEQGERPPELRLFRDELIVDNFAGGGGASLGIGWALGRDPDIAINHNPRAIAMHKANHPNTEHLTEDVWDVDPVHACRGRPVGFAWFSPDCTYHSKARGGVPFRDKRKARKIRGLAWVVIKWAKAVRPRVIGLENVEEFEDWGPLGEDGKPCPLRRSFTFLRWKKQLENLGYVVDYRVLSAHHYGAPTTRKRLFLFARCDGRPIVWPAPTHGPGLLPYRTAAECIDWSIPCPSIFLTAEDVKRLKLKIIRPLAENTMNRIARGLQKFVIDNPRPFIVNNMTNNAPRSVDDPLCTILTGNHKLLTTPYITRIGQASANGGMVNGVDAPLTTITSKAEHLCIAPYLIPRYGERPGQDPRALAIDQPHPTIVPTQNGAQLVAAFMAKHYGGGYEGPGLPLDGPVHTITAYDHHALVTSNIIKMKGTCKDGQAVDEPLHTIQAGGYHYAEVRAFLTKYHRDGGQLADLFDPMPTVVTNDSLGLVMVCGEPHVIVDIGMRMLKPRELFRAQGFPDSYIIDPIIEREIRGKWVLAPLTAEMQVDACGNSVSPIHAKALIRAQFIETVTEVAA